MTLSVSNQPQVLRQQLAAAFVQYSTPELSWRLGQLADTPSTAFFIGYQAAMRCIDSSLKNDAWAAFAVSERGIKNPYESRTTYYPDTGELIGEKSHVMLANNGLDTVYVLAKLASTAPVKLVLVAIDASALEVYPAKEQPLMQDVHHHAVCFSTQVTPDALLIHDAHNTINKPFRCWEDVHIGLALAGWLYRQLEQESEQLIQCVEQLIHAFQECQGGYTLVLLDAVEQLIHIAQKESSGLTGERSKLWKRDSMLLVFSQRIRNKIREKLQPI